MKTWNTPEITRLCLERVANGDVMPAELAVVDLGEDRETKRYADEIAKERRFALVWIAVGHRLAPSEANRVGNAALSTRYGCLLDSDVLVPRNWLPRLLSLLASPSVALAAPIRPDPFLRYPGDDRSTEAVLDDLMTRSPLADIALSYAGGRDLNEFAVEVSAANGLEPVSALEFPSFASSCCLAYNRAIVEDVGGIGDAAFDGQYGSEDVDLSWRVVDAGYTIERTADVFIMHLRHSSLRANRVDLDDELVRANRVLYQRWRSRLLDWGRQRIRRGDTIADLKRRFIIRELMRHTTFESDLRRGRNDSTSHC